MSGIFDGGREDGVIFARLRATGALTAPRRIRWCPQRAVEIALEILAGLAVAALIIAWWIGG